MIVLGHVQLDPSPRLGARLDATRDAHAARVVQQMLAADFQMQFDRLAHILPNQLTGIDPESVVATDERDQVRGRGLVVTRRGRNGGSFVAAHADPLTFAREAVRRTSRLALRDLGAHYAAITGACVRLAARRADASETQRVRRRLDRIEELDPEAQRRLLDDVQIEIVALSQSARLTREQMKLQAELSPFLRLVAHETENLRRQGAHLAAVIDAVEAGDPDAAGARTELMAAETIDALIRLQAATG